MEIIVQLVESPPGTVTSKHFHNGEEVAYVLEGGMVQFPGKEPEARKPGQIVMNKREAPHAGYTVVGDKTIKSLNIYIVDKGKPLAVPVQ
jgi:quercetin dioxygenase-like cupin family protein